MAYFFPATPFSIKSKTAPTANLKERNGILPVRRFQQGRPADFTAECNRFARHFHDLS